MTDKAPPLTVTQEFILLRGSLDPFKIEDLQERQAIDMACVALVEMGVLERRDRERQYLSLATGMPYLRPEHFYVLRREAHPLLKELQDRHSRNLHGPT